MNKSDEIPDKPNELNQKEQKEVKEKSRLDEELDRLYRGNTKLWGQHE